MTCAGAVTVLASVGTAATSTTQTADVATLITTVGTAGAGLTAVASATNLAPAATVDTVVDAVKLQTDKFVFTVTNQVDANAVSVAGATPDSDTTIAAAVAAQADIAAGLATIAKVETTLEADDTNYKFTVDALAQAPSGTGASAETIADAVFDEAAATHTGFLTTLALAAELAKVPKSDSTVSWNATALAAINAEVDTALNTAIPGSPTADSINERVKAIDDQGSLATATNLSDLHTDVGTAITNIATVDGIADDIKAVTAQFVFTETGKVDANSLLVNGATPGSAADMAEAVRDVDNTTPAASSLGAAVNSAASAGDPWSTDTSGVPATYGAGTFGKLVVDNLNAPVATIDTVVDAIKVQTDKLVFTVTGKVDANALLVNGETPDSTSDIADANLTALEAAGLVETDGAAKRFTANALEEAPTGSGSGLDADGVRTAIGLGTANLDTQLGTLATATALATVDGVVDTISGKVAGLTFSSAGKVDANVKQLNSTTMKGAGTTASKWGPA